ncbi:MAG: Peptide deformylase [Myxococcaceae bacterium]|nr:Peptide deformylase [Myxococcaceae bacterium]
MAIRKIAHIGHPVLRQPSRVVGADELASPEFQRLIDDLIETMRDANGAGLAAPQIYEPVRLCALEVNNNPRYPYKPRIPLTVLINPVIELRTDERFDNYEGCLSVPNFRGVAPRATEIRVTALDREGKAIDRVVRGLTAGTFQHEVDHLDGLLFLDRMVDPKTLTTWPEFERHHQAAFVERAKALVARYGE